MDRKVHMLQQGLLVLDKIMSCHVVSNLGIGSCAVVCRSLSIDENSLDRRIQERPWTSRA